MFLISVFFYLYGFITSCFLNVVRIELLEYYRECSCEVPSEWVNGQPIRKVLLKYHYSKNEQRFGV